jgi:hypothetical protein
VKPLVEEALAGRAASFFVYGQTGSGKTYTISGSKYEEGVFQLAMKDLLDKQRSQKLGLSLSTFEVYKEQVFDLLGNEEDNPLKINEKKGGGFQVEGLTTHSIQSWSDFKQCILKAEARRHFAQTYLFHQSSRSHFGVQVWVGQPFGRPSGVLNFFDLAGCEKFDPYKDASQNTMGEDTSPCKAAKRERLIEGQFINKSVFYLDQVLKRLAEGKGHIPFRSSAITKLLKNSLTGISFTSNHH